MTNNKFSFKRRNIFCRYHLSITRDFRRDCNRVTEEEQGVHKKEFERKRTSDPPKHNGISTRFENNYFSITILFCFYLFIAVNVDLGNDGIGYSEN